MKILSVFSPLSPFNQLLGLSQAEQLLSKDQLIIYNQYCLTLNFPSLRASLKRETLSQSEENGLIMLYPTSKHMVPVSPFAMINCTLCNCIAFPGNFRGNIANLTGYFIDKIMRKKKNESKLFG